MSNCRPRIIDCLNAVDQFLEERCNSRPNRGCGCDDDNLFVSCRPNRPCSCHEPCHCNEPCHHNHSCCNKNDCCCDEENFFAPCNDRRGRHFNCHSSCQPCNQPCGNSFGDVLHDFIGKKVMLNVGNKCGAVVILAVHNKCVRAMVVGSGKIILINSDNIVQLREIC